MPFALRARLRAFFADEGAALNLAVFRIVVFASLLWVGWRTDLTRVAELPATLRIAPWGYAWCLDWIPFDSWSLQAARAVLMVSAAAALVGWRTRAAALIACMSAVYVLGVPNFFGKVDHLNHHLIWFSALLAASPSADALSLDARRSGYQRSGDGRDYALPLRFAWLLIGIVYFFPGIAKMSLGPEWILGDNIRYLLHEFWSEKNFLPLLRIDRYPLLYRSAGALVVLFEIGFLPGLFFPRLRPWLIAGGLMFHVANGYFLHIFFVRIAVCYVAFVDWAPLLGKISSPALSSVPAAPFRRSRATVLVGSLLLAANLLAGVVQINSWPFSIYPRFASIWAPVRTSLEAVIRSADGSERRVAVAINRHALRAIAGLPPGEQREQRLQAVAAAVEREIGGLKPGESLQLFAATRSTAPEDWDRPPSARALLLEHRAPRAG